jgi:hypothetical protein
MRRLLVAFAAAGALVTPALAHAQTQTYPCAFAPPDYIVANDADDGAVDGQVSYPEPRVFLEAQGHVFEYGATQRHHFEHIHIGMCFPYAEVWKEPNDARSVDVRYVFHEVRDYTITKSTANLDGGLYATVTTTGKSITGLSNQPHLLEVEAFDAAGNVSARGSKTFYPPNWSTVP